ncbi:MAG: LacI family DNA-binding transcriptional regulator [Bacteroidota bacterium]
MKKGHQTTLYDIASRLNVSVVTVSKVFRGNYDISDELAKKVKVVANELGYIPNHLARNLSAHQSKTIGVVFPNIAHPFFSSALEEMYETAISNDYELILGISQDKEEREIQQLKNLMSMRVDGIIISVANTTRDTAIFKRIIENGTALTFMDRVLNIPGSNKVVVDDLGGAYSATKRAVKSGHKRIAYLGGTAETNIGKDRFEGYTKAMQEHSRVIDPGDVVQGGFTEEDGYKGFKKIAAHKKKLPHCIVVVGSLLALGLYRALQELHLTIPDDVDVISFGVESINHPLLPQLSTIVQPSGELGKSAVEITLENIRYTDSFKNRSVVIPFKERFVPPYYESYL